MVWRYVVCRSHGVEPGKGEYLWEVRELYLFDDGTFGYTENAVAPQGETLGELLRDLEHMRADADGEVLDLTVDPPRLVPLAELSERG